MSVSPNLSGSNKQEPAKQVPIYPEEARVKNGDVSLVPKGISIGLAIFTLILVLAGYGFRLALGEDWRDVLPQALILVPLFVVGVPALFWLGALIMNKLSGANIQRRNAFTLGWLIASVTILWLMGTYS